MKQRYQTNKCPMCSYEWESLILEDLIVINYKNNEMEYREREKYFNEVMTNIRNQLYEKLKLDKHKKYEKHISNDGFVPILSVNPKKNTYRFHCFCFDCPCNEDGLCCTEHKILPKHLLHEFDGVNIIQQYCG